MAAPAGPGGRAGTGARAAAPARLAVAPPGGSRAALAPLPVAALRLEDGVAEALQRVGLNRIGDLYGLPRGALARRYGTRLMQRLDQALGVEPEPVSPARAAAPLAVRLTLPEPIGLLADLEAGVARLLPPLCAALARAGLGARRLRLEVRRADHTTGAVELGLARPGRDAARLLPLLRLRLGEIEAGFGIDMLRLSVPLAEPLSEAAHSGHLAARAEAEARASPGGGEAFAALLARLGTRVGIGRLIRFLPADSHIPEKTATLAAAAYAAPEPGPWPAPPRPRPLTLFPPEPVTVTGGRPPATLRWRRRDMVLRVAQGPERIAPEWWLDDPAWRSGPRDYWQVEGEDGTRLWLFEARGTGGWFVQGVFG